MKQLALIRPLVRNLRPYVPGEQPKIKGLIKLNTNENPVSALAQGAGSNPGSGGWAAAALSQSHGATAAREAGPAASAASRRTSSSATAPMNCWPWPCGRLWSLEQDGVPLSAQRTPARRSGKCLVQFFTPAIRFIRCWRTSMARPERRCHWTPISPCLRLPSLKRARQWNFRAALTFVTTPNAPSGRGYSTAQLEELCRAQKGVVVLDEAYVDFARENALALALKHPHVIVARTFSKAYSLCFQRVGYFVGHPELIAALHKIRDSYNVNGLGQIAALATLGDLPHYRANFRRIIATRDWLSRELERPWASGSSPARPISSWCARRNSQPGVGSRSYASERSLCDGSVPRACAITCASPSVRQPKPRRLSKPPR